MLKPIQKPTPNFTVGRDGHKPELIVLHISTSTLASMTDWFSRPESGVSAHYCVGLKGEIYQFVKDENSAWTQGKVDKPTAKLLKPNINPNKYCLSIEHEGTDLAFAPEAQLNATTELIASLAGKWGIMVDRDHILGHYETNSVTRLNCPTTKKQVLDTIVRRVKEFTTPIPNPVIDKEKIKNDIKKLVDLL